MDERTIFNRFHKALDVEPRPGAYDRMRFQLTSSPVVLKRRPAFRMRFTTMGFRIAAAMVAAVIVIVAVVAYVSLHRPTASSIPAGPPAQDVRPYQALTARDYARAIASASNHCNTIADTGCSAAINKVFATLEAWQQDLNNTTVPPRFTEIDAMLRAHLTQAVVEGNAALAAQAAHNSALFDAAMSAHFNERPFLDGIAAAIALTRVVSSSTYSVSVQSQMNAYASCTPCAPYLTTAPVTCAKAQLLTCLNDVVAVDAVVFGFESAVVQQSAPAALVSKDAKLQRDLVAADTALLAEIRAALTGDAGGFSSAAASGQSAMAAVSVDVTAIKTG